MGISDSTHSTVLQLYTTFPILSSQSWLVTAFLDTPDSDDIIIWHLDRHMLDGVLLAAFLIVKTKYLTRSKRKAQFWPRVWGYSPSWWWRRGNGRPPAHVWAGQGAERQTGTHLYLPLFTQAGRDHPYYCWLCVFPPLWGLFGNTLTDTAWGLSPRRVSALSSWQWPRSISDGSFSELIRDWLNVTTLSLAV